MEIQDSSEQRGTNTNKNYIDESNTNPILSSEEMGTEVNEVNEWAMMYQYFGNQLYIEYFLRNRPIYSIRFAICIVKKYNIVEQIGRKCKKYSMKL